MKNFVQLLDEYEKLKSQMTVDDFKEEEVTALALEICALPSPEFKQCMKLGRSRGLISAEVDGWDFI